jgi:hypothetical protein
MIVAVLHQLGRSWRRTVPVDGQWRLLGEKERLDEHSAVVCWGRPCATEPGSLVAHPDHGGARLVSELGLNADGE